MNVTYVNSDDEVIGAGSIANAVEHGVVVRISRVFVVNSKGELLIQRRAGGVSAFPGRWDQSAAGHVDEGESYEIAAARELFEEMGIQNVELAEIAYYYGEEIGENKTRKRFNKIFTGSYDGQVSIDNNEVSDFKWIYPDELTLQITNNPEDFTNGFIESFKIYKKQRYEKVHP